MAELIELHGVVAMREPRAARQALRGKVVGDVDEGT
jgi:hypothetical protein